MIYTLSQIAAKKLSLYLKDRLTIERFEQFSFVLDCNITKNDIIQEEEKWNTPPFQESIIFHITQNNSIARTCLELALFAYVCPFAEEIFGYVIPNHEKDVSLKLSALLSGLDKIIDPEYITDAYFIISKILISRKPQNDITEIRYYADFTLISLLQNQYTPSFELEKYITFFSEEKLEDMILWEENAKQLSSRIRSISSAVSIIYGEKFSGRRFFAAYTAKQCGLDIYIVDFNYFSEVKEQSILRQRIDHVIRDCFLLKCALCISNITENDLEEHQKIVRIIDNIFESFSFSALPLFLTAEKKFSLIPYLACVCFHFTIPKLNAVQSRKVWDHFNNHIAHIPREYYASVCDKILLPIGKIKQVLLRSSLESIQNEISLSKLCYESMDTSHYQGMKRIYPKYQWDDLKLAETEKNILKQICSHVVYKPTIMNQWNMQKFYSYGNCVSALFTGSPGTGKTMAAHVIANELHLALYQVDLSQILDKYIGETEKRLEEIFDIAEKGNVVLFLDEADALLGKRSEINDSHDKYANHEMAYILQRIESFDGILIMATNLSNNIDHAFLRRIRYVVNFTMPDKNIRNQIWKSLFHEELPHDEIDFDFLSSDDFAFSGASIKNIMMSAMVKASADQKPLNMQHLMTSVEDEFRKMGSTSFSHKWKQYH